MAQLVECLPLTHKALVLSLAPHILDMMLDACNPSIQELKARWMIRSSKSWAGDLSSVTEPLLGILKALVQSPVPNMHTDIMHSCTSTHLRVYTETHTFTFRV